MTHQCEMTKFVLGWSREMPRLWDLLTFPWVP